MDVHFLKIQWWDLDYSDPSYRQMYIKEHGPEVEFILGYDLRKYLNILDEGSDATLHVYADGTMHVTAWKCDHKTGDIQIKVVKKLTIDRDFHKILDTWLKEHHLYQEKYYPFSIYDHWDYYHPVEIVCSLFSLRQFIKTLKNEEIKTDKGDD